MITKPPNTTIDQFIVSRLTGVTGGKKLKKTDRVKKTEEKALTAIPAFPILKGPVDEHISTDLARQDFKIFLGRLIFLQTIDLPAAFTAWISCIEGMQVALKAAKFRIVS